MLEKGGSDLHLTVGLPPKSRISGSLQPIGDTPLDARTLEGWLKEICPEKRWLDFLERRDLDLAHEVPGLARFRGNYLYNHWGQAAVFRQIPSKVLSFEDFEKFDAPLPAVLKKFAMLHKGLVLVTGPTGSGKTTLLQTCFGDLRPQRGRVTITGLEPAALAGAELLRKVALLPQQRQNLLFSATFPEEIRNLAKQLLRNPAEVQVAPRNAAADLVTHVVHPVAREKKRGPVFLLSSARKEYSTTCIICGRPVALPASGVCSRWKQAIFWSWMSRAG